jgi:hypothetical protein
MASTPVVFFAVNRKVPANIKTKEGVSIVKSNTDSESMQIS